MDQKLVKTGDEIAELASFASDIWHEAFSELLTIEQIEYMLEKFLSPVAIAASMKDGYEYYYLRDNGKNIGFTAICPKSDNTLFLSKLYLIKEERGKGYLEKTFDFLKGYAKEKGLNSIWLTVNKQNHRAIAGYKKMGMKIIRSEVTDIGSGFVMDDYVFSLVLKHS